MTEDHAAARGQCIEARRPGRREWIVAAGVMMVAGVLLFSDVWILRRHSVASPAGDADLFVWYLRWMPWALAHGQDPLVTTRMLAPDGANLMWNTSVLLPSFLLAPVTVVGGPELAFNVLVTVGPALSGLLAWRVLRRHAGPAGALAGGLVFAFGPPMAAQSMGHPMITVAVFPPLVMLLLEVICRSEDTRERSRMGWILGIAAAAQLVTGAEMLALTAVAAAAGLGAAACLHPRAARTAAPRLGAAGVRALAAGAVAASIPLGVMFLGPQHLSGAALQPPDVYVQDAAGLVVPVPTLAVTTSRADEIAATFTGNVTESAGYLGLPLLVLVGLSVTTRGRKDARVAWATLTAAFLLVLALGPHLHVGGHVLRVPLPWRLFGHLPVMTSLLPGRLMVLAFLPIALIVALNVDALWTGAWRKRVLRGGLLLLVTASLAPRPVPGNTPHVDSWFIRGGPGVRTDALVLASPLLSPDSAYPVMRDQAAADLRFRVTTGGAFVPGPRYGPDTGPLDTAFYAAEHIEGWAPPAGGGLDRLRAELVGDHIDAVVVTSQPLQEQVIQFVEALVGRAPVRLGGVALWVLHP